MIATPTPRTIRAARSTMPARSSAARSPRCWLSVLCILLAAGIGPARADDPAGDSQEEGAPAAPPAVTETVAEPPGEGIAVESDSPPVADELMPGLVCDDCCPGCDECCPGFDGCCPDLDECCPIFGGCCPAGTDGCDWLDPDLDCCDFSCDGCDAICGRSDATFYLGLEFGVLDPQVDALDLSQVVGVGAITPDHSYEFAPRFFGGFQTCDGWGGQISYWTLETGVSGTSLPDIYHDLDLQTVDVDITKTFEVEGWSIQIGGGGRWGDIDTEYFSAVSASEYLTTDFDGTGPTVLLNIRRPLGCGSWALVGEGRASFLFGDTSVDAPLAPTLVIDDDSIDIWEGRLGIEWTGQNASGNALFFVRALLEGQYWNLPDVGTFGSPALSFLGPTISAGFVF